MISYLEGPLIENNPTYVVVLCGGVGYKCQITARTAEAMEGCEVAKLQIASIHKEGTGTELFAFTAGEERDLFELLTKKVNGVGPKTALAVLNGVGIRGFRKAVVDNDANKLAQTKGIGAKIAERIILELRDHIKIAEVWDAQTKSERPEIEDAILALMALGFAKGAAEKACRASAEEMGLSSQAIIKAALNKM